MRSPTVLQLAPTPGSTDVFRSGPVNTNANIDPAEETSNATPGLRVSLTDGGATVGLANDGDLEGYPGLAPATSLLLKEALKTGNIRISSDAISLRSSRGVLMSGVDGVNSVGLRLNSPIGEVVATDAPRLSWEPLTGAENYVIDIYDENFIKVTTSGPLVKTTWSPKLRLGRVYVWQVTATRGGEHFKAPERPAPDARFKVLSQAGLARIRLARQQYPGHHLLLGLTYADVGLLREALAEFESLANSNPRSPLPRKFISSIQASLDQSR